MASVPIPAADAAPSMTDPPETGSEAPPARAQAQAGAVRPGLWAQVVENPLLSFFGLVIATLLAAAVAAPNIRINDTNENIDRLEASMEAGFSDIDAKFDKFEKEMDDRFDKLEKEMDDKFAGVNAAIAEIDRKLTALIAHLNATSAVDNALEGQLTA